ncbi:Uncharacterised protein [uncultured archaeon]|nr:Uncharacterised protein [uncultured archaeon]
MAVPGENRVHVPGPPLILGALALPAVEPIYVPLADKGSGQCSCHQNERHHPAEGDQQGDHGQERYAALAKLQKAVYYLGRPKRSFPLGLVQCIIILRILVELQVHLHRLGVKKVLDVVGYNCRLGLANNGGG